MEGTGNVSYQVFQQAFSQRAKTLKTRGQAKKDQQYLQQAEAAQQGLSKKDFWEKCVNSKEDVEKYYKLYHPEFDDLVIKAIANRLELLLIKYNTSGKASLTPEELELLKPFSTKKEEVLWDPMEDINKEMLEGKIKIAEKRMDELLKE